MEKKIAAEFQKLSYYAYGMCIDHWHPEMELLHVTEGVLEQQAGNEKYRIREGEWDCRGYGELRQAGDQGGII